jgi:hypothetical protein
MFFKYDKWVGDLFQPFEISIKNIFKHPSATIEAIKLFSRIKRGKLNEMA